MEEKREAEIVWEVLLGNVQPFGLLVREYQCPIYNLMLRMVGDEEMAADLAQEAFMRAYEKIKTFKRGKRFFPWLYSVSLNVARDCLRKNGRDKLLFFEDAAVMAREQDRPDGQESMQSHLDGEKAFEVVLRLDPKYRETLILRYKYDFSMQEIASALGITVSGAKMRISRGLDLVRQQFDGGSND